MKEVKKCSISGIAFTMEADAFQVLSRYLESLNDTYRNTDGGKEIVEDIEARIAELILSHQDNSKVVELSLVEEIIAQMGSAEAIREQAIPEEEQSLPEYRTGNSFHHEEHHDGNPSKPSPLLPVTSYNQSSPSSQILY